MRRESKHPAYVVLEEFHYEDPPAADEREVSNPGWSKGAGQGNSVRTMLVGVEADGAEEKDEKIVSSRRVGS